jgi:Flp pilus assembly protein TadG
MYIQHNRSQRSEGKRAIPLCGGKRTGVAAVEFAFVAPVMFLLIFATFEFGRALMTVELITEAARAGCRGYVDQNGNYWPGAIIAGTTTQQVKNAVINYLTELGINGESVNVFVNQPDPNELTVQVTVPVNNITWVPNPSFINGTLTGKFTLTQE